MQKVIIVVCVLVIIGDVEQIVPVFTETVFEGPAATIDADVAEIIETTGEVVS